MNDSKPHRPTAEELDEKLSVPLDPEAFVDAILQVKPEDEDDAKDE